MSKVRTEEKVEPTVDNIFKVLTEGDMGDGDQETKRRWSRTTLFRFMRRVGFSFSDRPSAYDKAKERPEIRAMRADYLERIKMHRAEGRTIFYQDETWIFKNMARKKVWRHNGISNDVAAPAGRGPRCIVSHVGSSGTGLVPEALLMFRGSKASKSADYHSEMNTEVFMNWLEKKVLPGIKRRVENAVLVLDRAPYHTPLTKFTKRATASMKKQELVHCIEKWGGPPDDWPILWRTKKLKSQLLELAKNIQPAPKFLAQEIADKFGVVILFLPIGHPELNPIEMLWAQVKGKCEARNQDFKLAEVERIAREEFAAFSKKNWRKLEPHVIKVEEKYYKTMVMQDQQEDEGLLLQQ